MAPRQASKGHVNSPGAAVVADGSLTAFFEQISLNIGSQNGPISSKKTPPSGGVEY